MEENDQRCHSIHPFPSWPASVHWNCWLSSNVRLLCIELACRSECWKACSEVDEWPSLKTFEKKSFVKSWSASEWGSWYQEWGDSYSNEFLNFALDIPTSCSILFTNFRTVFVFDFGRIVHIVVNFYPDNQIWYHDVSHNQRASTSANTLLQRGGIWNSTVVSEWLIPNSASL